MYKNIGLSEARTGGEKSLIRKVDFGSIIDGMSNEERIQHDWSPIDKETSEKIELHHMGQEFESPYVELTSSEHRKVGNYNLLHPKRTGSWRETKELMRQNKRRKVEYWKNRMKDNKTERRIETWKK